MILSNWAKKWGIDPRALVELRQLMGVKVNTNGCQTVSETTTKQDIRIQASKKGIRLWRNNSGAFYEGKRLVRYGLANDSKQINSQFKSSDYIGITPHIVGMHDIGKTVGVFTSIEVKPPSWKYRGTKREKAQYNWIKLIMSLGGIAFFSTGEIK